MCFILPQKEVLLLIRVTNKGHLTFLQKSKLNLDCLFSSARLRWQQKPPNFLQKSKLNFYTVYSVLPNQGGNRDHLTFYRSLNWFTEDSVTFCVRSLNQFEFCAVQPTRFVKSRSQKRHISKAVKHSLTNVLVQTTLVCQIRSDKTCKFFFGLEVARFELARLGSKAGKNRKPRF